MIKKRVLAEALFHERSGLVHSFITDKVSNKAAYAAYVCEFDSERTARKFFDFIDNCKNREIKRIMRRHTKKEITLELLKGS